MAIQYNSNFEETMPFSDVSEQFSLTANNELTFTVPGAATAKYQGYFGYNCTANIFVCLNASVTIPVANSSGNQQYCELRPKKRYLQGGDVIHLKTPDATAWASLTLRQLPG